MLQITNVQTLQGTTKDLMIASSEDHTIDGTGLTALPGLMDPHVHFRVPGAEHKEDWRTGARAAIAGGITTVIDMPNNTPVCTSMERVLEKQNLIEQQLRDVGIPLRHHLYLGADANKVDEIAKTTSPVVGIKVFMGASTGDLLVDQQADFERVCAAAADKHLVVAVHAEDEMIMKAKKEEFASRNDVAVHSRIRDREAAVAAVKRAIETAARYHNTLYILHTSTREEVELIREAKQRGLSVFAETTPHHLFLNETAYTALGTRAQMNPPLRTEDDQNALWGALQDGTIDTIGTDHAPHTLEEKSLPYGQAPSGVPGIETVLPLMLTAVSQGKISLPTVVDLMNTNVRRIFGLPDNDDIVLVDMNHTRSVDNVRLNTKCGWSPFAGWELTGWPVYTIVAGKVFDLR